MDKYKEEDDKEIEIEYLPKLGEPLSIKTSKQGRKENVSSILNPQYKAGKSEHKKDKDISMMILTLRTISQHKYATPKQKAFALKLMEKTEFDLYEYNWIKSVKKKLSRP